MALAATIWEYMYGKCKFPDLDVRGVRVVDRQARALVLPNLADPS